MTDLMPRDDRTHPVLPLLVLLALSAAACESRPPPAMYDLGSDAGLDARAAEAGQDALPDRSPDQIAPDVAVLDSVVPDSAIPDSTIPDAVSPDTLPPDACLPKTFYLDGDGDGYGGKKYVLTCSAPQNYVEKTGDCDDANKDIHPGAKESCNAKDDNCNSFVDEGLPKVAFFKDGDNDGYGSKSMTMACKAPPGFVAPAGDCNDNNKAINPGAKEVCNYIDDNCNGYLDEGFTKKYYYKDLDKDGYGGGTATKALCVAPAGYVDKAGDCNDYNKDIHPKAAEQCNLVDDDCNGYIDDNLKLLTSYKDNDGDGYAAKNAVSQKKCDVLPGWTLAKDADGDKINDWDCDDSDVTIYPAAPTKCGDGKDNNCDGYTDRLCFTPCPGKWQSAPFKFSHNYSTVDYIVPVDLDGDGQQELLAGEDYSFAILDTKGNPLHVYSGVANLNWARGRPIVADIDGYDSFKEEAQTLEVLTSNGGVPRFYKLDSNKKVTIFTGTSSMYDNSHFMARDLDGDGSTEFLGVVGCGATGIRAFRFDKKSKKIVLVGNVADPDKVCQYVAGRTLTDLSGDGKPELLWGNGYAVASHPPYWGGKLYAAKFSAPKTLTHSAYCKAGTCFSTAISGAYGGGVGWLYRFGDELRAQVTHFSSKTPNVSNPSFSRYWRYDLTGKTLTGSPSTSNTLWTGTTDVDRDGVADDHGAQVAWIGLYDVDGDTYPDRVYSSGTELRVALWDKAKKAFVENAGSRLKASIYSVTVRAARDINKDGRLEVLSADPYGKVFCHALGKGTYSRADSLPPHFTTFSRTHQWDNHEPNEGADSDKDNVPDGFVQVPSALTAKGDFYSYLSSAKDKDHFLVNTNHVGQVCLTAPRGKAYTLKVYSYSDKWNNTSHAVGADGKKDGLVWQKASTAGGTVCFRGSYVVPYRYYEYKYVIGVESTGGANFSPFWPYWITTKK